MSVFKIKKTSDIKMPLPIADDFEVMVWYRTPSELEAFEKRCTTKKLDPNTRAMTDQRDMKVWLRDAPAFYIEASECKGLTPSVVQQLGIPLEEEPATDENGEIPITDEVIRELWEHAQAAKFLFPVLNFSREMLTVVELEKKKGSTDSAD